MRKTLYIVRRGSSLDNPFLPLQPSAGQEDSSILLIHDAVQQPPSGFDRVHALIDDVPSSSIPSSVSPASYQDMLRMIFEADTVTVLSLSSVLISGLLA